MPMIYKEVEVHVDLYDFDTDDLIKELKSRGVRITAEDSVKELVNAIWAKRRLDRDFSQDLDQLLSLIHI